MLHEAPDGLDTGDTYTLIEGYLILYMSSFTVNMTDCPFDEM